MRLIPILLLFFVNNLYSQIIGGAGVCHVNGNPNAITKLEDLSNSDCKISYDISSNDIYIYDVSLPVGSRWKLLNSVNDFYFSNDTIYLVTPDTTYSVYIASNLQGEVNGSLNNTTVDTVRRIWFDRNYTAPDSIGKLQWNSEYGTLDLGMGYDDVVQQIGQELYYVPVINKTASTIPNGTLVMIDTTQVVQGDRLRVMPAINNGILPSDYIVGVATMEILPNQLGLITFFGEVSNLAESNIAQTGITLNVGDLLYPSTTQPGRFTNVKPSAPYWNIPLAVVKRKPSVNNITILTRWQKSVPVNQLQDVNLDSLVNGSVLKYDNGIWKATSSEGITVADSNLYVTLNYLNSQGYLTTEVDGSITNEGILSTTSVNTNWGNINTNTSGGNPIVVTVEPNTGQKVTFSTSTNGGGIVLGNDTTVVATRNYVNTSVDSTRLTQDSILVYYKGGVIVRQDTINIPPAGVTSITAGVGLTGGTITTSGTIAADTATVLATKTFLSTRGYITGSGTSGQVSYWNSTSSQTGSNNLFWDAVNSRFGIGTTTPETNLTAIGTTTAQPIGIFRHAAATNSNFLLGLEDANITMPNFSGLGLQYSPNAVGIFALSGQTNGGLDFVGFTKAGGFASVFEGYAGTAPGTSPVTLFRVGKHNGSTNATALAATEIAYRFDNSGNALFRIMGNGNTIIQNGGTFTDSGFRLDVNGTARFQGNTTITGTGFLNLPSGTTAERPGTPTVGMIRNNTTNNNLDFYTGTAWENPLKSATATGLGTAGRVFFADANGRATGDAGLFWDNTNKRLGVGLTNPGFALEVDKASSGVAMSVSASSGNSPALILQNKQLTIPNYSSIGFSPALTTNQIGTWTNVGYSNGGMAFNGFSTTASTLRTALFFSGYSNSTATTGSSVFFRAAKHNGATNATAVEDAGIIFQFNNWLTTYMQMYGNGNLVLQGGGAYTDAGRRLQVVGEARITDLTTDTPTRIVGADADGDLGAITVGSGLTLSGGTLTASGAGTTNLTFSGASSPVTLNSDTGTDVTFTAGTNVTLSQSANNLTINASEDITNEGILGVNSVATNWTTLTSNTSTSSPVNITSNGGTGLLVQSINGTNGGTINFLNDTTTTLVTKTFLSTRGYVTGGISGLTKVGNDLRLGGDLTQSALIGITGAHTFGVSRVSSGSAFSVTASTGATSGITTIMLSAGPAYYALASATNAVGVSVSASVLGARVAEYSAIVDTISIKDMSLNSIVPPTSQTPGVGFGARHRTQFSTGVSNYDASYITTRLIDVATKKTSLEFSTRENDVIVTPVKIEGTDVVLSNYGVGNKQDVQAYTLGVTSTGKVVEDKVSYGEVFVNIPPTISLTGIFDTLPSVVLGDTANFVLEGSALKYIGTTTKRFLVNLSASVDYSQNANVFIRVRKNTTGVVKTRNYATFTSGVVQNLSTNGIVELAPNDKIQAEFTANVNGNAVISNLNLTITQL